MSPEADEMEEERLVVEALRRLVASRVPGGDYKRFDRSIGKGASGWTWKFLNSHPGLGTPTLRTILRVLKALAIEPSRFFAEALPPAGATALEEARAASAAYEAAWREMERRFAALEERVPDMIDAALNKRGG